MPFGEASRSRLLNLRQRFIDEFLSAETRIHRHDQQRVNLIEVRLNLSDGRGRVDGESDFYAERSYFPEQLRDAFAKFNVNDDLIGAGLGERFQQNLRLGAHEMHIEEDF